MSWLKDAANKFGDFVKETADNLGDKTGIHSDDLGAAGSTALSILGGFTGAEQITDLLGGLLVNLTGGSSTSGNTGIGGGVDSLSNSSNSGNKVNLVDLLKKYWYVPAAIVLYFAYKIFKKRW